MEPSRDHEIGAVPIGRCARSCRIGCADRRFESTVRIDGVEVVAAARGLQRSLIVPNAKARVIPRLRASARLNVELDLELDWTARRIDNIRTPTGHVVVVG